MTRKINLSEEVADVMKLYRHMERDKIREQQEELSKQGKKGFNSEKNGIK